MAKLTNVEEKATPERHHEPPVAVEQRDGHPFTSYDIVDLPLPLPSLRPHQTRPWQAPPMPGAWAQRGSALPENREQWFTLSPHPVEMQEPNTNVLDTNNHSFNQGIQGLAVANLVESNNLPTASPQEDVDALGAAHIKQKKNRQCYACILLALFIFLSATHIILFAAPKPPNDDSEHDVTSLPPLPSLTPTSVEDFILTLFPEDTVRAIVEINSPQAQAYEWLLADDANLTSFSEERMKQRFALATLFFATKGDGWVVNSNWLNYSVHECDWYIKPDFAERGPENLLSPSLLAGFFPESQPLPSPCDENGLFQHLWLDQNNLDGMVPEELFMLTSLKSVSWGSNQLEGTISTLAGQLTALEGLAIKGQKNAGPIPTEIGILTSLRALILIDNGHHGYFPAEAWQLTNLETFFLGSNPNLNGSIPSEIDKMSNLNWMMLFATGFSGAIPSEIARLKKLSWLTLPENWLTGTLPTELGLLSQLTFLSVFVNALDGALPTELGLLSSLQLLSLRDNKFIGTIPSELGLLTKLKLTLNLKNNQLTSTIPTELGMLSSLAVLDLKANQLTGQIPSELGQFTGIGKLTCANNSFSGTIPQELSTLKESLYSLRFEGNALMSGMIPESLCRLDSICVSSSLSLCEGNYGLSFDCSSSLCGCNCSCSDGF